MVEYFRDGGFSMWMILITGIVTLAIAFTRKGPARYHALFAGGVVTIAQGMLGMATGMGAVRNYVITKDVDPMVAGKIVAQGLGELANNGTFSFGVALLLAIVGLAMLKMSGPATAKAG